MIAENAWLDLYSAVHIFFCQYLLGLSTEHFFRYGFLYPLHREFHVRTWKAKYLKMNPYLQAPPANTKGSFIHHTLLFISITYCMSKGTFWEMSSAMTSLYFSHIAKGFAG